jgi:hypothetical protein
MTKVLTKCCHFFPVRFLFQGNKRGTASNSSTSQEWNKGLHSTVFAGESRGPTISKRTLGASLCVPCTPTPHLCSCCISFWVTSWWFTSLLGAQLYWRENASPTRVEFICRCKFSCRNKASVCSCWIFMTSQLFPIDSVKEMYALTGVLQGTHVLWQERKLI